MHLVKTREREKYDTPPAAQQRNNLLKKEKPGESRALTNVYFYQFTSRAWRSLRQPGDLVRQARHLPARIVLVNDVALRGLHQFGFCMLHGFQCCIVVAAL